MADTTTPNIVLTNQQEGSNNNTWGQIADANFETIDNKFGDTTSIATTGGTTVLTNSQEIVGHIDISGTLVSNAVIEFSGRGGNWIIRNNTTGSFSVTCKLSGTTGVAVGQGSSRVVWCEGSDIVFGNEVSNSAEETIASAATTDVLGSTSDYVLVTGTTAITSLGTGVNKTKYVRFSGVLTLTYNASSLILPGLKSITTEAGDTMVVVSDSSSNVRVYAYQRASGRAIVSSIEIGSVDVTLRATEPTNWLFVNGDTVGNASSGGTARASDSADTEELFTQLWDGFTNTELPIEDSAGTATTRGASASADFAANKRMPLPDARGKVIAALDNMGGTSGNNLTGQSGGVDGDVMGAVGGSEEHALVEAELAPHTHGSGSLAGTAASDGAHTHKYGNNAQSVPNNGSGAEVFDSENGADFTTSSSGSHTHSVSISSGVTGSAGSGSGHNNVQPTLVLPMIVYAGAA